MKVTRVSKLLDALVQDYGLWRKVVLLNNKRARLLNAEGIFSYFSFH